MLKWLLRRAALGLGELLQLPGAYKELSHSLQSFRDTAVSYSLDMIPQQKGLLVRRLQWSCWQCKEVEGHAGFLQGKPFFPSLISFMTSGPTHAMVLSKPAAIQGWRELMGPTNTHTARAQQPTSCALLVRPRDVTDTCFQTPALPAIHGMGGILCNLILDSVAQLRYLAVAPQSCSYWLAGCVPCMGQMARAMPHTGLIPLEVLRARSSSSSRIFHRSHMLPLGRWMHISIGILTLCS
jgi:hypothetical protein